MVSGLRGREYNERCKEIGLETLKERRELQDTAQVFKLVHGIDKIDQVQLFEFVPAGRTRLAADPLNIRAGPVRTDVRKNFFTQRVINSWNSIPTDIKNSRTVQQFKSNYRKWRATLID
jgi:hypothetical protein